MPTKWSLFPLLLLHSHALILSRRSILEQSLLSTALSPTKAATDYDSYASNYNALDGSVLQQARIDWTSRAQGSILEVGVGTGLNLPYYTQASNITALDISVGMLEQAQQVRVSVPISFRQGSMYDLVDMFGPKSFDTVVDTFSLCVLDDPLQAISQIAAVARQTVLLLENTRAPGLLGNYQDVTAQAAAQWGGKGCVYNQNVGRFLQQTPGLRVVDQQSYTGGIFTGFECQVVK